MFKIRTAYPEDAPRLAQLCRDCMGYDYPLDLLAAKLEKISANPLHRVFVAVAKDSTLAGFIHTQVYDVLYAPTMLNILGLAVDSSYRRQGAGSMLLSAAELDARHRGITKIRLVSGMERENAHQFYLKNGYLFGKTQLNLKKEL